MEKNETGESPFPIRNGKVCYGTGSEGMTASQRPIDEIGQVSSLFDQMTNGFVYGRLITDNDGSPVDLEYLDMNPAFEGMIGARRADVLGKLATDIFPEVTEEQKEWLLPYARAALLGESTTFERQWPLTGRWYSFLVYGPRKGFFIAIAEDINDRKNAEQALREGEERFRSTLDSMIEGCQIIGRDWRYIYINAAAERHTRRPNEEL